MQASQMKILEFIDGQDKKFIIPVYQRPYSWKKDNCSQLMKDLTDVYTNKYETHFFGAIVYVTENNGIYNEYSIIDGQQRITTVSLLLLAIMDYVNANPQIDFRGVNSEKIKNVYLVDQYAAEEKKLKLKLVQNDDAAYDALLSGKSPIENNRVTANYNYFRGKLEKLTPEELAGLYNAITKLMIVSISLKLLDGDNPQLIFESLNSTGLALESSDKVRNYVLMNMNNEMQGRFFHKYWKPLEELISREEMNRFIRYYLEVKTNTAVSEAKIYGEFKRFSKANGLSMDALLADMMEYAEYYKEINNPFREKADYTKVLKRINKLEVKTCVPLCLNLFKAHHDGNISTNDLCKALQLIENYLVRREICDLPTNALNKVFIKLGGEIERDIANGSKTYYQAFCDELMKRSGKSRFPNNHDFEDKFSRYDLYNAKGTIRKYILERLENFDNREQVAVEQLLDDETLTIEHIMPQTLTEDWKKALGKSGELTHTKYKDTIGNLTLTAYNSDYSNSPFLKKRDMKEKGFKFSKLFLNGYVAKCDKWGEDEILERAGILFRKALKIWWIPQGVPVEENSEEWFDWDEDFDTTSKLLSQVKVMGQVIKTENVTDAFVKVNNALYEMDPATYHENNFSWVSNHQEGFQKPREIGHQMYVETNKSSAAKFSCIKTIAKLMKLDSSDISFLLQEKKAKTTKAAKTAKSTKGTEPTETTKDTETTVGITDEASNDEQKYSNLRVGELAYELIAKLISSDSITAEEIESLKTREFTQKIFTRAYYPAVANERTDNQGKGKKVRYRKTPLVFKGRKLYVSTEWFEPNRKELIDWYRKHLNRSK